MQKKLKVHTLQKAIRKEKSLQRTIGFVPTMGALHAGHISLVKASMAKSDTTVCSIFVNPTQFNDTDDLEKYPRTMAKDARMLSDAGVDYLFAPTPKDIYPENLDTSLELDLNGLDMLMEGAHRPGHFQGVVQVVKRLLDIVQPDHLYMGQKDFQQFTIIRHMIDTLGLPVELVVCPIMREPHGLAMSSRNERLLPAHRSKASIIYQTLSTMKDMLDTWTIPQLQDWAMQQMEIPGFRPEYVSIIDGHTLRPLEAGTKSNYIVACTAVWAGQVRLIDNVILKKIQGSKY